MVNDIQKRIIEILDNTFNVLDQSYEYHNEASCDGVFNIVGTRLVFPSYSDNKRRVSEQELRFIFVEQFNDYCRNNGWEAYYSIETPTKKPYRFPKGEEPRQADDGRSAMIDLCIHNKKGERICLLEFKAQNPPASSYKKDFLKLSKEKGLAFFVHILEKQDKLTMKNIKKKKIGSSLGDTNYICHTIKGDYHGTQYISAKEISHEGWKRMFIEQ